MPSESVSTDLPPISEADLQRKIAEAKIAYLYRKAWLPAVLGITLALVETWILRDIFAPTWLAGWFAAVGLSVAGLLWLVLQYRRHAVRGDGLEKWGRYYANVVMVIGATVGVAGPLGLQVGNTVEQVYIVFALALIVMGATASLASLQRVYFGFVLPALMPTIIWSAWHGAEAQIAMSAMLALFAFTLVFAARQVNAEMEATLRLSFEHAHLVKSLSIARKSAEQVNRDLQKEVRGRRKAQEKLSKLSKQLSVTNKNLQKEVEASHRKEAMMAKQAASIYASEVRLRAMFANTRDGLITFTEDGIIESFNPAAEHVFGYREAEMIGVNVVTLMPELERDTESTNFGMYTRERASGYEDDCHELTGQRKNGEKFPMEMSVGRVDLEDYALFVGIFRDIGERKQAEKGIIRAMELAEQANRAKSEFLSSMSHELRTPMNAILGFGQLLKSDTGSPLNELQQESVSAILTSGWHLLELINEVLDLSRIEAGEFRLELEHVDLVELVNDCLQLVGPSVAERRLSVVNRLSAAPPSFVHVDPGRLKQVVLNLLSNGVKYNSDAGQLTVELESVDGQRTSLAITDTGNGMTAEQLAHIFEPFNRLGQESGDVEGTGIGLTIAKSLIEQMGGFIKVESAVGQGSTFRLDLPLVDVSGVSMSAPGNTVDDTAVATEALLDQAIKVLYIEDDSINIRLIENAFKRHANLDFLTARSAELGLKICASERPDVVLMDINLPGMDGFSALQQMSADRRLRQIPVIAVSANAMPEDVDRGMAAGFFRYLTKPVDVNELFSAIQAAVQMHPVGTRNTNAA